MCADENSANISLSDTFNNFHDYELRWTPDKIEWLIDGEVGRVQERKDTWNKTSQNWEFPQTPARVQLSLWPGGLESNPKGTIDWAGGVIDWDHRDIKDNGYFYATVESVKIECFNGDGIGSNDGKSYTYSDVRGTNDTVVDGDEDHILASLQATGMDMDKGKPSDDDKDEDEDDDNNNDNDNDDEDEDDKDDPPSVPGGVSPGQTPHEEDEPSSGGGGDNTGTDDTEAPPPSSGGSGCERGQFCQGLEESNSEAADGDNTGDGNKSRASVLAMIVAGFALYWL